MKRLFSLAGLVTCLSLACFLPGCSDDDDNGGGCGDGVIGSGEQCDGDDLDGATCESLGFAGGDLACDPDTCQYDTSGCDAPPDCGNGMIDSGESCDGTNLDGETCDSQGFDGGTLSCSDTCQFDTSQCTGGGVCGNGLIDGEEDCDGGFLGGATCESLGFAGGDLSCTGSCEFDTSDCYDEPTFPIGEPCTTDDDCPDGVCFQEAGPNHFGPAGGYCYEACDANGNCPGSGPNGVCVEFSGGSSLCMKACDPTAQDPDCRAGYQCEDLGGNVGVCFWGFCDDDSQCTTTNDCETDPSADDYGWCVTPPEDCTNGVDDDYDTMVDCGDNECTGQAACPMGEICGNDQDDDGDNYEDCDDAECANLGICTGEICTPPSGADLTCGVTLTGESNDAAGSTDVIESADCVAPDGGLGAGFINEIGPEYAYTLTVNDPQLVTVTVDNYTGDLDIYIIKEILGECDAHRGCFAWGGEGADVPEVITFAAYPNTTYYVVVDGFEGNIATYDISVECEATGMEDCTNGSDDDSDGLADCEDPECWGVTGCDTETECNNGFDDDLDGALDCYDSDCNGNIACEPGLGYWEMWERNGTEEFDMTNTTLAFTVDASDTQGFTYAVTGSATTYPYTPGDGDQSTQDLAVDDESNVEVTLPWTFNFEGTDYDTIYVSDDGYISFVDEAAVYPGPGGWNLYHNPRIAVLWADYDPSQGGTITYDEYSDHIVITWDAMLMYNTTQGSNQFQLVLHQNGNIEMHWLTVDPISVLPSWVSGFVTMVGANIGQPPAETDFAP
jgi:hypothetical protein